MYPYNNRYITFAQFAVIKRPLECRQFNKYIIRVHNNYHQGILNENEVNY